MPNETRSMPASAATPSPAARAAPWSCHPRTTTTISCAPTQAARVHVCINRDALLRQLAALLGEPVDQAIEQLQRAMRLSPRDPLMFTMQGVTAFAHFFAGRYDEATSWAEKAFWERPNILATLRVAAASYALAGRLMEARKAIARALLNSTPICALPISRTESGFFAAPKITQNMRMRCARLDFRNEPFGTTTHGLRLAKSH